MEEDDDENIKPKYIIVIFHVFFLSLIKFCDLIEISAKSIIFSNS